MHTPHLYLCAGVQVCMYALLLVQTHIPTHIQIEYIIVYCIYLLLLHYSTFTLFLLVLLMSWFLLTSRLLEHTIHGHMTAA